MSTPYGTCEDGAYKPRACAPMATPGRDRLPARHQLPGRSATL